MRAGTGCSVRKDEVSVNELVLLEDMMPMVRWCDGTQSQRCVGGAGKGVVGRTMKGDEMRCGGQDVVPASG